MASQTEKAVRTNRLVAYLAFGVAPLSAFMLFAPKAGAGRIITWAVLVAASVAVALFLSRRTTASVAEQTVAVAQGSAHAAEVLESSAN